MLLDPDTLDLLPRARDVLGAAADERFKLELPAAQLEITLPPAPTVAGRSRSSPPARAPRAAAERAAARPPPACIRSRRPRASSTPASATR